MQVIWGQVSQVTSPILNLWGMLKLLILQQKRNKPNSDTSYIVGIHHCHVSLPYFCIFDFVWRHRWRHWGAFGSSAFFVNDFRSPINWDRESGKAPLWWHWAPEPTDMYLDPPSWLNPWPEGVWPDLDLEVNLDLPISKHAIRYGLMEELWWCFNFDFVATFEQVMSQNQT